MAAVEQPDAERILQQIDLLDHSRWGYEAFLRCLAEAASIRDLDESIQLVVVHGVRHLTRILRKARAAVNARSNIDSLKLRVYYSSETKSFAYGTGEVSMKSITRTLIVLLMLLSLVACSSDVSQVGDITINVTSGISKGLEAVSMDTTEYHITMKEGTDSGKVVLDVTVPVSNATYTGFIAIGTYKVSVDALNKDGQVIGTGSNDITVTTGTNSVNVNVKEKSGEGTFKVAITGNPGYELEVQLLNSENVEKFTRTLSYTEGKYTAETNIQNGFYKLVVTRTDTGKVLRVDTCRIVAGYTTFFEAEYSLTSGLSVGINNEIVKTPQISLSLNKTIAVKKDSIKVSATMDGLSNYTCYWVVDGATQGTAGTYGDLVLNMSEFDYGEHEVSLFITKDSVLWSESTTFKVVEAITSLELEGEVEFWVVGDVLIPTGYEASLIGGGNVYATFDEAYMHSVVTFDQKETVSCELQNLDGYFYSFEIVETSESRRTVVYIVIDKDIQNCGYLDITFDIKFVLNDYASRSAYINANTVQVSPNATKWKNSGLVNIVNGLTHRRIKVEPDTYRKTGTHSGSNARYYRTESIDSPFVVAEGETVSMTITSTPFASVSFVFPEDVSNMTLVGYVDDELMYGDLHKESGNTRTTDLGIGDGHFHFIDSDNPYESRYIGEATLVEGSNRVELTKEETPYTNSVELGTTKYSISVDIDGFAIPETFDFYYRIDNGDTKEYGHVDASTSIQNKATSISGGSIGFSFVRGGAFSYNTSSTVEGDVTHITLKLVPANGEGYATGKLVYDFDFADGCDGACPIIWLDNQRYIIDFSNNVKLDSVKLVPGTYVEGGSLRRHGDSDKWLFVKQGFTATAGDEVEIHLINDISNR